MSNKAVRKKNEDSLNVMKNFVNNNIKPSLFESLGVSEVQNLHGKYFVFHMNLVIQEARTILNQSIISIEKTSSSNTL